MNRGGKDWTCGDEERSTMNMWLRSSVANRVQLGGKDLNPAEG